MSALAFLVRHRTVDLVAMTATHALRSNLAMGASLIGLRRDDVYVIEEDDLGDAQDWAGPCSQRAHWFNPNKHRYALFEVSAGAVQAVQASAAFPRPWLKRLVTTDRRDLVPAASPDLAAWVALPRRSGAYAVALASWDREQAVTPLPSGSWPRASAQMLRLQLWCLALSAADVAAALAIAEDVAITRSRTRGLLIHPHVEGWTLLEPPWPLDEESTA